MIGTILGWLTSGPLDRVLDTVDRKFKSETDREKIKGDVIQTHMKTRAGWIKAGGFWILAAWNAIMMFHIGSIVVYSVFWCENCAYPQGWTIAALPQPLDIYQQWIIIAGIGGQGLLSLRR